ncbi:hypothetical protein DPMN_149806 [Dreissena polymorpha]|uniref:Immunoglobulin I-set domain-containing protein n=1 Tax=Dreissena polymorpha TaxID=45954 RepID=A0A9D4FCA7_DREPO|nr:hypothetical protein DPMN_149806 [Dreissena polymorpha]
MACMKCVFQASSKYELFNNGTLRVHNVEYEDVAFYTCTAGNAFGEISESARLNISGNQKYTKII